jgi:hypothetical protein
MNRAAEQRSRTTARYSLRKYVGQDRANRSQGTFEPRTSTSPIAMEQLLWADAGHASADLGERTTALRSCRGSLPRVVRRSRAQEQRAIRNHWKTSTFSPPRREKTALLQRHLPNRLGTARGPFSLSLGPFSPQAENCVILVLSLDFHENQAIRGRCNPAKFESATGSRKIPQNVLSRSLERL